TSPNSLLNFHLTSRESHAYPLQHNHLASNRLNLQHFLWREVFNFTIHPSIHLPSTPPPSIADIATGTALWLLDVSRLHPSSPLTGLDITLTLAPAPSSLPRNITLQPWDLFTPIPPSLSNNFDLIHIRLLILVLSGIDDTLTVLHRLHSLLRPGGYIQWEEIDVVNMVVRKDDESMPTPALDALRGVFYAEGRHDWIVEVGGLRGWLERVGFTGIRVERYCEGRELGRAFGDLHLWTVEEVVGKLEREGKGD
ncbi:hypothetical protein BO70DRAFT_268249, partial [Aspergillus heteromorphus CBS 117.55]